MLAGSTVYAILADMTEDAPERVSDIVALNVKALRAVNGWSAKQLAAECAAAGAPEITSAVVANIETGRRGDDGRMRRDVTVDELLALARTLNVSPATLMLGAACDGEPGDDEAAEAIRGAAAAIRDKAAARRARTQGWRARDRTFEASLLAALKRPGVRAAISGITGGAP
jgi:transcriptional regulator with XRE-family HTH domain